ncbi:BglG family transcription antiterminator [Brassicibacter mesophilus]|uniref:BglG family transcription antiterminator n=1 Tax=Brassicibacter mesophilus TaxID=745119 RepID=UPI003D1A9DC4
MDYIPDARCWEIVNVLLNAGSPLTIDKISKELNVSNKTIRNDLKNIEEYFDTKALGRIVKKPGVGIWIETDVKGKRLIEKMIDKSVMYIQPFSTEQRRLYIIKRLLRANKRITMQQLAEELYVSRITIYKDLEEAEDWLLKYGLKLNRKQKSGIEVTGDEKEWRKALADLLVILKHAENTHLFKTDKVKGLSNTRLSSQNYIQLKELIPDIDIQKIEDTLVEVEKKLEIVFTDESFNSLVSHIAISLKRIFQNKAIQFKEELTQVVKQNEQYNAAKYICSRLEKEFRITIPESEIYYISIHIMGAKKQYNYDKDIMHDVLQNIDPNIVSLSKEIISLTGSILSVDFSNDKKLFTGLLLHLQPAVNRLRFGLSLRNPLLGDIKSNYPSVFGAAWATSVLFEKYLGVKVNEEEIGYIAIHIGAALERIDANIRAIIICGSGIGTSQLAAIRLKKAMNDLEIIDIISAKDIEKISEKSFDIVITTIPFEFNNKPTIQVNPLIMDRDIDELKRFINNIKNTRKFY